MPCSVSAVGSGVQCGPWGGADMGGGGTRTCGWVHITVTHRWVPVNLNMDMNNPNSQLIRGPMKITPISAMLVCPLNSKFSKSKRISLTVTFSD